MVNTKCFILYLTGNCSMNIGLCLKMQTVYYGGPIVCALPAAEAVEAAGRSSGMGLWGSAEGSWSTEGFPVAPPAAAAAG